MKLQVLNNSTEMIQAEVLSLIFPEFGKRALEIPVYDSGMGMYIVEQHTSASGNRNITYVAVSPRIGVELTIVLYHGWTIMSKVRLLIPSGSKLNVVKTFEWPLGTYYDKNIFRNKVDALSLEYAKESLLCMIKWEVEELEKYVIDMTDAMFSKEYSAMLNDDTQSVLKTYCKQMNLCKDYTAFEPTMEY